MIDKINISRGKGESVASLGDFINIQYATRGDSTSADNDAKLLCLHVWAEVNALPDSFSDKLAIINVGKFMSKATIRQIKENVMAL